ncbi:hypothetical protein TanjilG_14573 [Lupinus angustifolius]|uniref:Uncharacterized protein n=1 Tax=Lupinus angustifolius TaxID=3871 RepID=A0A1J7H9F8_LUPAN|nr:hypothetical protein TanjilG_14573 [Lupinus angustifolius]
MSRKVVVMHSVKDVEFEYFGNFGEGRGPEGGWPKGESCWGENERSIEKDADMDDLQLLEARQKERCVVPIKETLCKRALSKLGDKDKSYSLHSVPILALDSLDWTDEAAYCPDKVLDVAVPFGVVDVEVDEVGYLNSCDLEKGVKVKLGSNNGHRKGLGFSYKAQKGKNKIVDRSSP